MAELWKNVKERHFFRDEHIYEKVILGILKIEKERFKYIKEQ